MDESHQIEIDGVLWNRLREEARNLQLELSSANTILRALLGIDQESTYSYEEAQSVARELGLEGGKDWRLAHRQGRLPQGMPLKPEIAYQDEGWRTWRRFLGSRKFLTFEDAKDAAQTAVAQLALENGEEIPYTHEGWLQLGRSGQRPSDVPSNPNKEYKEDGWRGWSDWMKPQGENQSRPIVRPRG